MIGKENVVADALSHKYVLISTLNAKLLGFEHIKELYVDDHDFSVEYQVVKRTRLVSILGMMVTYFRRINCVCLIVL